LYLPGLKNVVADFLSCPNQTTTGSIPPTSVVDPVDSKRWPPSKTVARKRSVC
jgi:hypothetical protein